MYSTFHLIVVAILSSFTTAAVIETIHFLKDRKKEKASK